MIDFTDVPRDDETNMAHDHVIELLSWPDLTNLESTVWRVEADRRHW
jgi:hypothetical protein